MDAKGQNWPKYFSENQDKSNIWPKKREEKNRTGQIFGLNEMKNAKIEMI